MARKQQSVDLAKRLDAIRKQRLEIEVELAAIQAQLAAFNKTEAIAADAEVVQQNRRKLQYPKT